MNTVDSSARPSLGDIAGDVAKRLWRISVAAGSGLLRKARVAAIRLWRTVLSALVVVIAIALGVAIPYLLADQISAWRPAGLTFGAATVLAVIRELLQTLPTAIDYIVSGVTTSLPKLFVQVGVAALGIGFAWYAAVDTPPPPLTTERSLNLNVGGSLPPIVLNESGSVFVAYVTFAEQESVFAKDDYQFKQIDSLVQTLAQCIQDDDDTIDIVVRAYASSSGSDSDNEKLYKERGKYVAGLLAEGIRKIDVSKEGRFKIEVREWKSLKAMQLRRLFKDTDNQGVYLPHGGALNRRADIVVRSAGSCLPS